MERFADLGGLELFSAPAGDENEMSDPIPPTTEPAEQAETGEEATSDAGENHGETRKTFRELIAGEYKDEFTAYFNEVFSRRFKEQKGVMEELRLARTVMSAAETYFGVKGAEQVLEAIGKAPGEAGTAAMEQAMEDLRKTLDVQWREKLESAVEKTRLETERAIMETIRARGVRPAEIALSDRGSNRFAGGVRLTKAERAAVALRAAMGEKIEL